MCAVTVPLKPGLIMRGRKFWEFKVPADFFLQNLNLLKPPPGREILFEGPVGKLLTENVTRHMFAKR